MLYVDIGGGAQMSFPSAEELWQQRYGQPLRRFTTASALASYEYLVLECTKDEAWRRIKLLRAARREADALETTDG